MQLRGLSQAGAFLFVFTLAACGGDDTSDDKPGGGTGPGEDSSIPIDMDAGDKPNKPKKDAAMEMDAAMDAAVESGTEFPQDAEIVYTDSAIGAAPSEWVCKKSFWYDEICDCGCGAYDADCFGTSCKEPGCLPEVPGCQACFDVNQGWMPCEEPPSVDAWTCTAGEMSNDGICDCGCGIPYPTCQGSGCTTEGCYVPACVRRHGADVDENGFADVLATSSPPPGWTCAREEFGGGDGCDCGCGVEDPDCGVSPNCTGAKCTAAGCEFCHDTQGRRLGQCSPDLVAWTCDPRRYGAGDGCDCGCGVADPDCAGDGCEAAYCRDNACDRCTDVSNGSGTLVGCTPASDTWECDPSHYGTGDGCDCGCGITDPDCNGNGCTTKGCTDDANDKCDYCHAGNQTEVPADYVPCGGWTCGDDTDTAWTDTNCDCGCGKPDPACRALGRVGCTAAGCETAVCQFCNEGNDSSRTSCGGDWLNTGRCGLSAYGRDGLCDCGCGALDPDCAADEGCAEQGCAADGCEICHQNNGALMKCYQWNCKPSAYADGETCNCGCGAEDPDCSALGCKEPGCSRPGICEVCHDPYGRPTACP